MTSYAETIRASFVEAQTTLDAFLSDPVHLKSVETFAAAAEKTLKAGGLLMSCGNGGSMCDAMHFAEEWTGRFRGNRAALPAMAFSDPSQLSCIANDFGYDQVFARSVEAYGKKGDLLVAISTSGNCRRRAARSACRRVNAFSSFSNVLRASSHSSRLTVIYCIFSPRLAIKKLDS